MNQATGNAYLDGSPGARPATPATKARTPRTVLFAAGSAVLAAALSAVGTFKESRAEVGEFLVIVAVILVAAAVVFGLVAAPALRKQAEGNRPAAVALVLSILGVLSIAVFWTGLPPVLAGGAALLALEGRTRARSGARRAAPATSALVLAGITVVLAVVSAIVG